MAKLNASRNPTFSTEMVYPRDGYCLGFPHIAILIQRDDRLVLFEDI